MERGGWFIYVDLKIEIDLTRKQILEELAALTKLKLLKSEVMYFRNKRIKRYSRTKKIWKSK